MPAAGVVMIIAVVLIVAGARLLPRLDDRRAAARSPRASTRRSPESVGIIEKTAPVGDGRQRHQRQPRRRRRPARGPARQEGRDGRTPWAWSTGCIRAPPPPASATSPTARRRKAPRISEVYTKRDADARAAGPRGADRRAEPGRPGAAQPGLREPGCAAAVPRDPPAAAAEPAALAGHRDRLAGPVRAQRDAGRPQADAGSRDGRKERRCRPRLRSSTSARPASTARSPRSVGTTATRGSSPAGTACCR